MADVHGIISYISRLRNGGSVVTSSTSSMKRHRSLNSSLTRFHSRLFGPYGRPSRTLTDVHPHSQSHSPSMPINLGILPIHLPQQPHVTTTESTLSSLYGTVEISDLFIRVTLPFKSNHGVYFTSDKIACPHHDSVLLYDVRKRVLHYDSNSL